MKPYEILQKIIDENGSCEWIEDSIVCHTCPIGPKCVSKVQEKMGKFEDADYLEVAKKLLLDLEVDRILLGDDFEI